jgi:hypothetical protein
MSHGVMHFQNVVLNMLQWQNSLHNKIKIPL